MRPAPSIATASPAGSIRTGWSVGRRQAAAYAAPRWRSGPTAWASWAAVARAVHQVFPGRCWVRGQIRNLNRCAAGHVYFELAEPGPAGAARPQSCRSRCWPATAPSTR